LTIASLLLLVVGCGGPAAQTTSTQASAPNQAPAAPKRLIVGVLGERKVFAPWDRGSTSGGAAQPLWLLDRSLTIQTETGGLKPVLAETIPSTERGDWRINPDGTMEQTWNIRPNARWQDGEPLSADDFVFGWQIIMEPALPTPAGPARGLITAAIAPDPATLVLRFNGTSPLAANALFNPYPRHILGDMFAAAEWDRLANDDFWTTGYISSGPYRLSRWEPGSIQEFAAFPQYVEGAPKIDVIVFKILGDASTLQANILSGDVEVALPDGLSVDAAADLKRRWATPESGNNVILYPDGRFARLEFQHKPEYARPTAARDPAVRRALYRAIDKEGINEAELAGLGKTADSWIPNEDPRRPQLQSVIPEWSYDPALAQRLLTEAGWRKGSDGVFASTTTGERLETEIRVTPSGRDQALGIIAGGWRDVGAAPIETPISPSLSTNLEYRSTQPFAGLVIHRVALDWEQVQYSCERQARPETRWSGAYYGYCSPAADPLIRKLQITIPEVERTQLQRDILKTILMDDQAIAPLYWQVTVIVHAKGITGLTELQPGPYGNAWSPWNAHLWNKGL
jgi:peptide/nickel transport system substrate-binding protein